MSYYINPRDYCSCNTTSTAASTASTSTAENNIGKALITIGIMVLIGYAIGGRTFGGYGNYPGYGGYSIYGYTPYKPKKYRYFDSYNSFDAPDF